MRRVALVLRLITMLCLALGLAGATALSTRAQDEQPADVTPEVTEEAPPEQAEVLQGTLTVLVFACASEPGSGGELFLDGQFTPDETCAEGGETTIAIDGGAPETVGSGVQYTLDEGTHGVVEQTLGLGVDVTIDDEVPATLTVVFYTAPVEAEGVLATGTIAVMKHVCPAEIQTQEQFDALGGFLEKLLACPVITNPGHTGPDGAVNGNDPDSQLSFDFEVAFGDTANTIDAAVFMSQQLCEADAGELDDDPTNNLCIDTSHYAYEGVTQGVVTVTEVMPPDGYHFGALELTPDGSDDAALVGVIPEDGLIELDTTGDDNVTLHVYNFQDPVENRVSIVKHECPDEIVTADDFAAIGDFAAKLDTCRVVLLGDDEGPDGAESGGNGRSFDFEVIGADGGVQTLAAATFVPEQLCESDLGQDLNGDPNDDLCLDASRYQLDGVAQGTGVLVTEIESPEGFAFGALEVAPESGDDAALVDAGEDGVIELDTTLDGDVTLHVFNFAVPPSPYGSVQVVSFFCYGPVEETIINVLVPGQEATAADMGDATCVAGDSDYMITLFGVDELPSFTVGEDGVEQFDQIPITDPATNAHVLTELYTLTSADFEVESDTVTRLIVLNYLLDEIVDDGYYEEYYDEYYDDWTDEATVEELPVTGTGSRHANGGAMLLLGMVSLLGLVGFSRVKRRAT